MTNRHVLVAIPLVVAAIPMVIVLVKISSAAAVFACVCSLLIGVILGGEYVVKK